MTTLPGILAEIAAATDERTAVKVALRFGGQTVKLPATPRETTPLARAVGLEAARRIVSAIGHGVHTVPMGAFGGPSARRRTAAAVIARGGSAAEAAKAAGVHERTAWRVKARLREAPLPLFDGLDGRSDSGGG
ncbi:MAG: helix-turn-helix domain-containing protein [Alphaproteobacteria bacterium]|nr:helix-turn-helix domain-containing protein [Alphaproteobacteria bacterium]